MQDKKDIYKKTFIHILLNNLTISITNFTVWFALTFFVILQTKSVLATGIISGLYLILGMLTAIPFGNFVDHTLKKKVFQISSLFCLFFFFLSFLVFHFSPTHSLQNISSFNFWFFAIFITLGVVFGSLRYIALPTLTSLLHEKKELDKANGLVGMVSGVSMLVTSISSAFLISKFGIKWVIILALIFHILAFLHLFFIKIEEKLDQSNHKKLTFKENLNLVLQYKSLFPMIIFSAINNFLGGIYMALMDAYGLSLTSVEKWGILWSSVSLGFIVGGFFAAKWGLGKKPVKLLMLLNILMWILTVLFSLKSSIFLLFFCMLGYMLLIPFVESAEQTILQKIIPRKYQGRVLGFSQTIEQSASPITAFLVGPLTQIFVVPFMVEGGLGAKYIGSWFGTGYSRALALVFIITGLVGLLITIWAFNSKYYKNIVSAYEKSEL